MNTNFGLLALYLLFLTSLLLSANQHGKPKTGKNDFWTTLFATIISLVLIWWALGWKFI